ncbi:MAG: transposase, partial [Thermodesulfovibrionales bacterium]
MRHKRQMSSEPTVQRSHKIALIPELKQALSFGMACGPARFPWNWALAEGKRQFDAGVKPNAVSLKKAFNAVKYKEFPWLTGINRDAPAEPFNHLGRTWAKFFKDCTEGKPSHAPVFKKKGECREFFYVANDKLKVIGLDSTLPIVGRVKRVEELRFRGKVVGATVSRSAHRWFVAIPAEIPERVAKRKRTGNGSEGVDLGITSAGTRSTGEKIQAPNPLKGMLRRLTIRTRRVSRKLE